MGSPHGRHLVFVGFFEEGQAMNSFVGKKCVVPTEHRGVFFGTLVAQDGTDAVLADARVCVYWSRGTRGFVGLAATGPLDGSRVSAACPRLSLVGVTAVIECTDEAAKAWEAGKWS